MIVNAEALARVYTALSAAFNMAFQGAEVEYPKLAMTVPATTRIMDYKFLLDFPMMREWIGDRVIRDVPAANFQVPTKDWESTIGIDRNDVEDEQIGLYTPLAQALAEEAKKHPDKLLAQAIATNPMCYDGQDFFSTTHPVGDGVSANLDAGAETAWYLFDTSRAIKPFVYQLRKPIQLISMVNPMDPTVFTRKKFQYGVDARYAMAVGLWQMAYKSTKTLDGTNYGAARAAMMSLKNAEGRPLGVRPTLLVVPPTLEGAARTLLNAQFVIGDAAVGGSKSNIWQGTASLLVFPELA